MRQASDPVEPLAVANTNCEAGLVMGANPKRARGPKEPPSDGVPGGTDWMPRIVIAALVLGTAVLLWNAAKSPSRQSVPVNVLVPALSEDEQAGERIFNQHCSGCHGKNAAGTKSGSPLVHKIYEPSHHSDGSFFRAVRQGVTAHHWHYGHMPMLPAVSDPEIAAIVRYVRALQRANGIK